MHEREEKDYAKLQVTAHFIVNEWLKAKSLHSMLTAHIISFSACKCKHAAKSGLL